MRRLRNNDFLQRKQDREFQESILAALNKEPKKRNWFVRFFLVVGKVINSAIFIWFLTAIFVTLGSGYLTQHRQCLADAEGVIERISKLRSEIVRRQRTYLSDVMSARTLEKAPLAPTNTGKHRR